MSSRFMGAFFVAEGAGGGKTTVSSPVSMSPLVGALGPIETTPVASSCTFTVPASCELLDWSSSSEHFASTCNEGRSLVGRARNPAFSASRPFARLPEATSHSAQVS